MSRSRDCPLCQAGESTLILVDQGQPVVRCRRCGFLYCNPIPDPAELTEYYTRSYEDWDQWEATFRHDRSVVFETGLQEIRRLQPQGRLLDVGCSLGFFLEAAQRAGYEVTGVDVSRSAVGFARRRLGLDARTGTLEQARFPSAAFEVVTLWDVLEHLPDPRGSLREIHRVLRPGGLLVVRLPNAGFHLPKARLVLALAPHSFIALDAHNHLNHYTPRTLTQALTAAGFVCQRLKAGPVNLYGKPFVDTVKQMYVHLTGAIHRWTGVLTANIMEAYARRVP